MDSLSPDTYSSVKKRAITFAHVGGPTGKVLLLGDRHTHFCLRRIKELLENVTGRLVKDKTCQPTNTEIGVWKTLELLSIEPSTYLFTYLLTQLPSPCVMVRVRFFDSRLEGEIMSRSKREIRSHPGSAAGSPGGAAPGRAWVRLIPELALQVSI